MGMNISQIADSTTLQLDAPLEQRSLQTEHREFLAAVQTGRLSQEILASPRRPLRIAHPVQHTKMESALSIPTVNLRVRAAGC